MKIKRFFAKDIRTALDEIKVVLGADAIIMSNKKVDGGVEIVAAVDDDNIATIPKVNKTKTPVVPTPPSKPLPASATRVITDDQVSLSGFQERLVKQQLEAQAQGIIADEQAKSPTQNYQRLAQAVERRQRNTSSPLPAWAKTQHGVNSGPDFSPDHKINLDQGQAASLSQAGFGQAGFAQANNGQQNNQAIDELRQEMASMRQLLQHQVNGLVEQDITRRDPIRSMILEQLATAGFDSEIASQLAIDVPPGADFNTAKQVIKNSIARRLVTTNNDVLEQGGIIALLGPTGVGKTTTVAKLAARYAMQYGSDQIALITTDSYRIGAYEQLNTYGKILGCPVKVAKDAQQLADALYQLRNKRLILIDTAGMGQRDIRLSEQLATLVNTSHVNIRSFLVLPATAQRKVLQEAIEQFRKIPISGCIITKVDEAIGLGEIMSVAIGHSLPIGYVTNGQRVPEDISLVDINELINNVVDQLGDGQSQLSSSSSRFVNLNR